MNQSSGTTPIKKLFVKLSAFSRRPNFLAKKKKQHQFLGTLYNAQKSISETNQSQSNFYWWSTFQAKSSHTTGA